MNSGDVQFIISCVVGALVGSQITLAGLLRDATRRIEALEGAARRKQEPVTLDADLQHELRKLPDGRYPGEVDPVGVVGGERYTNRTGS